MVEKERKREEVGDDGWGPDVSGSKTTSQITLTYSRSNLSDFVKLEGGVVVWF